MQFRRVYAVFVCAAMTLPALPARALEQSALLEMCRTDISSAGNYIMGFLDKYRDDDLVLGGVLAPDADSSEEVKSRFAMAQRLIGRICFPEKANVAAAIKLGCDWIVSNADHPTRPASLSLSQAFSEIWPCKE